LTTTVPALELESVSKTFAGVHALRDVSLTVGPGQIHGLVGQNGSGKSTLVKVLTGFHRPDSVASMRLWGRDVHFPMRESLRPALSAVHQDLGLLDELTVLENFTVTTNFGVRTGHPISWRHLRKAVAPALEEVGIKLDLDAQVSSLTQAQRALLCIGRSIYEARISGHQSGSLFLLDEATAHLDRAGAFELLAIMRTMADAGNSAILVSHRLREVVEVCDEITVLRDGQVAGRLDRGNSSTERILDVMLSRKLQQPYPPKGANAGSEVVLSVNRLNTPSLHDISLELHQGEVLGVTGLVDMGQDELPYAIIGASARRASGDVELFGQPTRLKPTNLQSRRVGIVPANRRTSGVWMEATVAENLSLTSLKSISGSLLLRPGREKAHARTVVERFGVRPPVVDRDVATFSGGNQQKVVIGKWFGISPVPLVMLLHEPTQGVDAGARWDLLQAIHKATDEGMAVLYFSSDHEELANVADRVIVLDYGRITAVLADDEVTEERIVAACHAL
jgi:ribose transport system ATP-binding protein